MKGQIKTTLAWTGLLLLFFATTGRAQQWVSPGPLHKVHAKYEGITHCTLCHELGKRVTNQKCLQCHDRIALNIKENIGYHAKNADKPCTECHIEHKGRDYPIIELDRETFDHAETGFKLEGRHKELECEACHTNPRSFLGLSQQCVRCHDDFHEGTLGLKCQDCHSFDGFRPSTFKHKPSQLQAQGAHKELACEACHPDRVYAGLDSSCVACHEDQHKGLLGNQCEKCHTPEDFGRTRFDHNRDTKFRLTLTHATLECDVCHAGDYAVVPDTSCQLCHEDEHKGRFDENCNTCHEPSTFALTTFTHEKPFFELQGFHKTLDCEACHTPGDFAPLGQRCEDCHEDEHKDWMSVQRCDSCHTQSPFRPSTFRHDSTKWKLGGKHTELDCQVCHLPNDFHQQGQACSNCHEDEHGGQLSSNCQECHSFSAFSPSTFKHKEDDFQMQGKHAELKCEKCHADHRYSLLKPNCTNCHEDSHHGDLGSNCQECHNFSSWTNVFYDHNQTNFPLRGQHQQLRCEECHKQGRFESTPTRCMFCHQDPHDKTFGTDCESCHNEEGWDVITFDHNTTGYELLGQHQTLDCVACHTELRSIPMPSSCYSCHRGDFERTTSPAHKALGFSTDCELCHMPTANSWYEATFDHNEFAFQLVGHHTEVPCSECHINGQFKGTPQDCYTCHWVRRQDDPWKLKLGTNCEDCHSPYGWTPAPWDHAAETGYALVGQHANQECTACHINYNTENMPTECSGCHMNDYQNTKQPIHTVAGFSTNCEECHKPSDPSWHEGYWADHETFFHLRTSKDGHHDGFECFDCHTNPYEMKETDCLHCHPYGEMVAAHRDVARFKYRNRWCLKCHPAGEIEP